MNHCLSLNCPATVSVDSPSLPLERLQSPPLLLENCIFTAVKPPAHKHTQIHTITHKYTNTHNHTHTKGNWCLWTTLWAPTLLNWAPDPCWESKDFGAIWQYLFIFLLGLERKNLAPILSSLVPSPTKVAARAQAWSILPLNSPLYLHCALCKKY